MKEILTTEEFAKYLKMNPRTVQRKARKGEIPAIRIGRQFRFDKEQIDLWLSHRMIAEPLNILVVDNDLAVARLFKDSLKGLGHKVTITTDGAEALEFAARKHFDLIFLDLQMPDKDGGELFARIRENNGHATMTIITDEIDSARLKRAMKRGPILLMHKPLDGDDVLEALKNYTRSIE